MKKHGKSFHRMKWLLVKYTLLNIDIGVVNWHDYSYLLPFCSLHFILSRLQLPPGSALFIVFPLLSVANKPTAG